MGRTIVILYKAILFLHTLRIPYIPKLLNILFIRILFGSYIGLGAKLGKNVTLGYFGMGIVIHHRAELGNRVSVGAGVTIGGTTKKYNVPIIGDNTIVSTGAKILGPIKIGRNCVIGANSVVLTDIPDNCVAVGVPAKVIKTNIDISNYR